MTFCPWYDFNNNSQAPGGQKSIFLLDRIHACQTHHLSLMTSSQVISYPHVVENGKTVIVES